jgi:hypothetical protein
MWARECTLTPSFVVFIFGLIFESFKEFGVWFIQVILFPSLTCELKFYDNMPPWQMTLITNKNGNNNHSKLKNCTYEFEKSYHENSKHKKCQHEISKNLH